MGTSLTDIAGLLEGLKTSDLGAIITQLESFAKIDFDFHLGSLSTVANKDAQRIGAFGKASSRFVAAKLKDAANGLAVGNMDTVQADIAALTKFGNDYDALIVELGISFDKFNALSALKGKTGIWYLTHVGQIVSILQGLSDPFKNFSDKAKQVAIDNGLGDDLVAILR